jgi:hypothetical protein
LGINLIIFHFCHASASGSTLLSILICNKLSLEPHAKFGKQLRNKKSNRWINIMNFNEDFSGIASQNLTSTSFMNHLMNSFNLLVKTFIGANLMYRL